MSKLRAFVRYRASGPIIAGSLITARSIPKDGIWREISAALCCTDDSFQTLTFTQDDVDLVCPLFTIFCNEDYMFQSSAMVCNIQTPTLQSQVDWLNTYFGSMGTFSLSGSDIIFKLKQSIINDLCPSGTLSFTVRDND